MKTLQDKMQELRRYYSDEQIAEDFAKYRNDYIKDGFDASALDAFVATARNDPGALGAIGRGLKNELITKPVAGVAQEYLTGNSLFGKMTGNQELQGAANTAKQMLSSEQDAGAQAMQKLRGQHPFATMLGEAIPAMIPSNRPSAAGRILSSALPYSVLGGMGYAEDWEQRARNAATYGGAQVVGGTIGEIGSRAIKPVQALQTGAQKRALSGLEREQVSGAEFKPRLSELTGSQTMANIEDTLAQTPYVDEAMKEISKKQRESLNAIAAKSIGQKGKELSPDVIDAAYMHVDNAYKALRAVKGKNFELGANLSTTAAQILKNQSMRKTPDATLVGYAQTAQRMVSQNQKLTGEAVDTVRQEIADLARNATGGDAHQWGELVKAFDESVRQGARKAGLKDVSDNLDMARKFYRNLKTIDRPSVIKGGDIQPGSLRTRLGMEGNTDPALGAIGDYGGAFEPLRTGSRSYGRAMLPWLMQNPITSIAALPAISMGAKALESDPMRAYLTRGLMFDPTASYNASMLARPMIGGLGTEMVGKQTMRPLTGGRR